MNEHRELGQAYVPFQRADKIFKPEVGFIKGTVFPELYRPYEKHPSYSHSKPDWPHERKGL